MFVNQPQIQPSFKLPRLRIGYFQPSIGVRYDDHTAVVRQIAEGSGPRSLIAPNYAEVGAELFPSSGFVIQM